MMNSTRTIVLFGMHGLIILIIIRLVLQVDLRISSDVHGMALFLRSSIEKIRVFFTFL